MQGSDVDISGTDIRHFVIQLNKFVPFSSAQEYARIFLWYQVHTFRIADVPELSYAYSLERVIHLQIHISTDVRLVMYLSRR